MVNDAILNTEGHGSPNRDPRVQLEVGELQACRYGRMPGTALATMAHLEFCPVDGVWMLCGRTQTTAPGGLGSAGVIERERARGGGGVCLASLTLCYNVALVSCARPAVWQRERYCARGVCVCRAACFWVFPKTSLFTFTVWRRPLVGQLPRHHTRTALQRGPRQLAGHNRPATYGASSRWSCSSTCRERCGRSAAASCNRSRVSG